MSAMVRALDMLNAVVESEVPTPAEVNRLGAAIWAADVLVERPHRAKEEKLPLPVWLVAVAYSHQMR